MTGYAMLDNKKGLASVAVKKGRTKKWFGFWVGASAEDVETCELVEEMDQQQAQPWLDDKGYERVVQGDV